MTTRKPPSRKPAPAPAPFNNPFGGLKPRPAAPGAPVKPPPPPPRAPAKAAVPDEDLRAFLEAVGEVAPVRAGKTRAPPPPPRAADQVRLTREDDEALTRLAELVAGEGALELAEAGDFLEGAVPGFDERVRRKLRAGAFAAQARLDLHGLTREEAQGALERFVDRSRLAGHRCVLVVTGRGLHSPDQVPVLRAGVQGWLSGGRSARHVLAFSTARPQDGGAGALYVLLRR
jgi:DNA-nicking Smr family endonuclease